MRRASRSFIVVGVPILLLPPRQHSASTSLTRKRTCPREGFATHPPS